MLKPYWKQISIMDKRLKLLQPLRQKIDLVLAPTHYTFQRFLENGFRPDQIHLLPFGVDMHHSLENIHHVPTHHTRFLFIGRLQPYKGAHLLIEAFNDLQSPREATLKIYGSPDGHEAYFRQLKTMMATNERVRFGGQIAPTELDRAFAEADYFVLPSIWHENSPLILLDALQSKTPVIASDIGGVTDLIKDGMNGLLFPMGDKRALQEVLQRAVDQPDLVEQLRTGIHLPDIDDYAETVINLCAERIPEFYLHESGTV
jgi:glycosyltransferase involved in cell wall biosynthesis